eukprot:337583-Amphidinium_carterae.1
MAQKASSVFIPPIAELRSPVLSILVSKSRRQGSTMTIVMEMATSKMLATWTRHGYQRDINACRDRSPLSR